jgi:hypothetical protein
VKKKIRYTTIIFVCYLWDKAAGITGDSFMDGVKGERFDRLRVEMSYVNLAETANFLHKFVVVDCSKLDNFFVDPKTGNITLIDFEHVHIYCDETKLYRPLVRSPSEGRSIKFDWYFSRICNQNSDLSLVEIFYDKLNDEELRELVRKKFTIRFDSCKTSDSTNPGFFFSKQHFFDGDSQLVRNSGIERIGETLLGNLYGVLFPEFSVEYLTNKTEKGLSGWKFISSLITQRMYSAFGRFVKGEGDFSYDNSEGLRRIQADVESKIRTHREAWAHIGVNQKAVVFGYEASQIIVTDEEMWGIELSQSIPENVKACMRLIYRHYIAKPFLVVLNDVAKKQAVGDGISEIFDFYSGISRGDLTEEVLTNCALKYIEYHKNYVESDEAILRSGISWIEKSYIK